MPQGFAGSVRAAQKIWRNTDQPGIMPRMTAEGEIISVLRAATERGLPSLLIGANAVLLLGYIRNTIDLDLLVPEESRPQWLDLMGQLGYRLFHGTASFAQFEARDKTGTPVDLMFVERETWEKLLEGARETQLGSERVQLPRPEYLVALKLHAAASPMRSKPELDWEDIRQMVRICRLDPAEESSCTDFALWWSGCARQDRKLLT